MRTFRRLQLTAALIPGLLFTSFFATGQKLIKPPNVQESWSQAYEPFRIAGNLYYVGTYDLACYLITTPQGHILINTGLAESVSMIQSNVKALGFNFSDIKILLATHAHYDHVGGMAEIKKITGAAMMIHEKDAPVLADGGNSDYAMGGQGSTFEPVRADRLLHDEDTVRLGGMQIIVLHHPGHTKGACSFLFDVKDDSRSYRVLIANMPTILDPTKLSGMPTYPDVGKDYANTFAAMKKLQFDIWLSSHASQFGLHQKRKPGDAYHPEAFIDRKGYDAMIEDLQKAYLKRLEDK
ncbi:MAG: subclass B3 metallo-beta-lactamase [Bacteroidota bacterium]|nr:subclass B3 metallo-beta-lactamase [Bacteroidota bacterium]